MIAGFSIFSMLFGSGNIVFPLVLGRDVASNWFWALIGWLITAVAIPLTGYYGAMLYDADSKKYLSPIGKHLTALLMFVIMMLVGPFGVMARIVNVSFGGIHNLSPSTSVVLFNAVYIAIMMLLACRPGKIVQIIGLIFTPLKFFGIAAIVIGAIYFGSEFTQYDIKIPAGEAVFCGFNMGYQTMDLLAAFIMAGTVYHYLKNAVPQKDKEDKKLLLKFTRLSCIIASFILAIAYIGLLLIGVQYSDQLATTPGEEIFGRIAELSMGYYASWFVSIIIAVSCMATSIILCVVFTDYVHKDILKEKFNKNIIFISVGITTFAMSLLGFQQICSIMGMVLEKIYPALIIFVGIKIAYYYIKKGKV
jgi:LIVCS family branched-chain amino acid:cation transporter